MAKLKISEIDAYIGHQMRLRRVLRGISQEVLADKLGVKFQQIQKYENGSNRLGASNLQKVADILGVKAAFFFQGLTRVDGFREEAEQQNKDTMQATSVEGLKLIEQFGKIKEHGVRNKVLELVKSIAGTQPEK